MLGMLQTVYKVLLCVFLLHGPFLCPALAPQRDSALHTFGKQHRSWFPTPNEQQPNLGRFAQGWIHRPNSGALWLFSCPGTNNWSVWTAGTPRPERRRKQYEIKKRMIFAFVSFSFHIKAWRAVSSPDTPPPGSVIPPCFSPGSSGLEGLF